MRQSPPCASWTARAGTVTRPIALLLVYLVIVYFVVPIDWRWYVHCHPSLNNVPNITLAGSGIPGGPSNRRALLGTKSEVKQVMPAAGCKEADPLGIRSDLEIAADTVLKRPDDQALVSNLYRSDAESAVKRA